MSCKIPAEVNDYLELVETGKYRVCKEQQALAALIRKVFRTEDLHVNIEQLHHYMGLEKYFSFKHLFPWEKFLVALWDCTYKPDGLPRWKTVFCMLGRGSGKDGFIAFDAFASVSHIIRLGITMWIYAPIMRSKQNALFRKLS